MSALGHQDAFLRPRLSTRYRFSQETFGRMRGKGRDASKAAVLISMLWMVSSYAVQYDPTDVCFYWSGE